MLSLSLYKPQLEGAIDRNESGGKKNKTKHSSCFPVKTRSESLLCLQLGAEASRVKGVEKRAHSLLTAVGPELMGVGGPRKECADSSESYLSSGESCGAAASDFRVQMKSRLLDRLSRREPSVTALAGHVGRFLIRCSEPIH